MNKLPSNYRIVGRMYGGTGHGDERFGLALEVYETRTERRILRRPRQVTGWWLVEVSERQGREEEAKLTKTAILHVKEARIVY